MQRRIDVSGVISRVLNIYVAQASVLMPAAAVVFVFTGIIASLLLASPGLTLLALLIDLVAGTLFTGMVVELVADIQDGRRDSSPGQLLQAVAPVLGQLILVGIIAAIGVVIGFFLLIIPGLFLITIWFVIAPVVVLERPGGALAALRRSRELVRGNGWQVFGVIFVLYIVVGVVSFIIEVVADSAGSGAGIVVRVIVGVLTAPLASLAAAVLYFELAGAAPSHAPPGAGGHGVSDLDAGGSPPAGGPDAERAFGG
jgi:hypothetical protein